MIDKWHVNTIISSQYWKQPKLPITNGATNALPRLLENNPINAAVQIL